MEDTVDGANVGQEVVSETGTGRSAFGETGNVDTGEERGDFRLGLVELDQPVESLCRVRKQVEGISWARGRLSVA